MRFIEFGRTVNFSVVDADKRKEGRTIIVIKGGIFEVKLFMDFLTSQNSTIVNIPLILLVIYGGDRLVGLKEYSYSVFISS